MNWNTKASDELIDKQLYKLEIETVRFMHKPPRFDAAKLSLHVSNMDPIMNSEEIWIREQRTLNS